VIDCDPAKTYQFEFVIRANQTLNNVTFKPMLTTDLDATYNDYVPYSGDGRLNENVAEIYNKVEEHTEDISQINADLSDSCKLEHKYITATSDVNGNVNITNLYSDIKPENFVSCLTDNTGINLQANPFINNRNLCVCIKEMYSGTAQKNVNVSLSINYTMPI
jgi:hypothetical protein